MARELRIRARVLGGEQARAAIRGITRESERGAQQQQRVARGRLTEEQRTAREVARAHAQMERNRVRETERSARAQTRAVEREAQQQRRIQEREAAAAARAQARAGQRRRDGLRALPGAIGAAAVATTDAAVGRVQGWQASLGVPNRDELVRRTMQNQMTLARITSGAGMNESQAAAIQARVLEVSRSTGTDASSLVGGLEVAQNRFSDLQGFADQLNVIAQAARAVDAPIGDVVGAMGEFQRQLGVTSEEVPQTLGLLADGMNEGSLEAGDVAANFSSIMSDFATLRGAGGRGVGGATEFLALAQALGASGAGPEGARTLMQNMMSQLRRSRVQGNLEDAMGDATLFDDQGTLTIDFAELMRRMAANPELQNAAVMEEVFGNDMQAAQARNVLLNRIRGGDDMIGNLMGVSAERGTAFIGSTNERIDSTQAGRASRIAAGAEANFMENGDALLRVMNDAVGPFTDLTTQYPLATEALGALRDVTTSLVSVFGALNLAMGGGALSSITTALTGGAGGTGALATTAAAAGGIGALPLLLGGGAIAGGAIAAGVHYQNLSAEEERRRGALALLGAHGNMVTPELLANATGDASLIGPTAQRHRTERAVDRQVSDEGAAVVVSISADSPFAQQLTAAVERGAQRGVEGRERDAHVQAQRGTGSAPR